MLAGPARTVEPISRRDMPGDSCGAICRTAGPRRRTWPAAPGSPRVQLQLNLHHYRIAHVGESLGHLARALGLDLLEHVQLAGVNSRNEREADEYAAEPARQVTRS